LLTVLQKQEKVASISESITL